jgi:glycosyltransferase involved in cell wall biosynthesis
MKYSIVVPFHNEERNVAELYVQTKSVMESLEAEFEFVFIDDGSTDGTPAILKELADCDERVIVVRLQRNYGKTEALVAGFEHAEGEYIIAMDGDLQHDPSEIPLLIAKLREGYDMVCGSRIARPGDSLLTKRFPSRIANAVMAKLTGVNLRDFGGGFKAFRSDLIKQIPLYGELQRFIPALASAYGARICEVPIHISERKFGRSHYGIRRLFPVLFDLITVPFLLHYLSRPMHVFGGMGLIGVFVSFVLAGWLVIDKLIFHISLMAHHGPMLIFSGILLLCGLILICQGLIGEMLLRKFHELQYPRRESHALRVVTRYKHH